MIEAPPVGSLTVGVGRACVCARGNASMGMWSGWTLVSSHPGSSTDAASTVQSRSSLRPITI